MPHEKWGDYPTGNYNPASASGYLPKPLSQLILEVPSSRESAALKLISEVDLPARNIVVNATLLERTDNKSSENSLQLLFGKLSSVPDVVLDTAAGVLRIGRGAFQIVANSLGTSGDFKQVSSPSVLVESGSKAKLISGTESPVLTGSSITNGVVTQAVEYRNSGVILEVTPTLLESGISMKVFQEVSAFAQDQGLIDSPSLTKRNLETTVNLRPGETIVLGGLKTNKNTSTRKSFFGFPIGKRSDEGSGEIILLLSAEVQSDS